MLSASTETRSATELITDLLGRSAPTSTGPGVDDELGRLVDNVALTSPQRAGSGAVNRAGVSAADDGFPSRTLGHLALQPRSVLLYRLAALCWRKGYRKGTKFWLDQFWGSIRVWLTSAQRPEPGQQLPFALPGWYRPPVEVYEPVVLPDLWEDEFQTPVPHTPEYSTDGERNQVHQSAPIEGDTRDISFGGNCVVMPGARLIVHPRTVNPKRKPILSMGKYVLIGAETVVEPSKLEYEGKTMYLPASIGDYTIIGLGAKVKAYRIGNFVSIGKDCVIEERVVIQDGAYIGTGVTVPAGTVVPKDCSWTGKNDCFATKFQQHYFPVRGKIREMYEEMFCKPE